MEWIFRQQLQNISYEHVESFRCSQEASQIDFEDFMLSEAKKLKLSLKLEISDERLLDIAGTVTNWTWLNYKTRPVDEWLPKYLEDKKNKNFEKDKKAAVNKIKELAKKASEKFDIEVTVTVTVKKLD